MSPFGLRRQHLDFAALPFRRKLEAIEELGDLAALLQERSHSQLAQQKGPFMDIETRHEPERSRFAAAIEGQVAHLDYAEAGEGVLDYRHTWVPELLRNRGIGERLVLDALDWARENGVRVIPTCPFVDSVVRRHPEYADLIAKAG